MNKMGLLAIVCGAAVATSASQPQPIFTSGSPAGDSAAVVAALNEGELACAFWVRFDKLPSEGEPVGLFGLAADKDGRLAVTIPAAETAMEGDYVFRSKDAVKAKAWHHVAFNYSLNQQRVSLYLDGHLQFENDTIYLPDPAFGQPTGAKGFAGAVRDLRVYDVALMSDSLVPARGLADGVARAKTDAAAARDAAKNAHLKAWAASLLKRADALLAAGDKTTAGELKELARDAAAARRLAGELPATGGDVASGPVTAYTVDPYGQERLVPYELPRFGELTGALNLVAAQGQREVGSLLVVALAPVKSFTLRPTGLVCEGRALPADKIDVKLVKRWFRGGGAWLSYHLDIRQRILTPHLLVNDDDLIEVDELRLRNRLRLDYPEGTRYVDVSTLKAGQQAWRYNVPFRDAPTLQPIKSFTEPGRNQQYAIAVSVPTNAVPGLYTGRLELVCDGKAAGAVDFRLRVLPFALPDEPASYEDLSRIYWSHMNKLPEPEGFTHEERVESVRDAMANIQSHGMNHTTGLYADPIRARMALEAGFIPDYVFGLPKFDDWRSYFPGVPGSKLTPADRELGLRAARRGNRRTTDFIRKTLPGAVPMVIFYSESSAYAPLNIAQGEQAAAAHAEGWQVFAHGGRRNLTFAGDIQDMESDTTVDRDLADQWHAGGGSVIAYAQPFASPENPAIHRRRLGFERYKGARYDGNMQHGFKTGRVPFNEFAPDPGGDGNYRCNEMAMPKYGGAIYTICWDGVGAAFDDIRYATLLKKTATECLASKDEEIRREARRQLIWLEQRDGWNTDLRMLRLAMIDRILTLRQLLAGDSK